MAHPKHQAYNLFLDDERNPRGVTWVELPLVEWTIVRTYNDFVETIQSRGVPQLVTFDHDLAEEHYREYYERCRYGQQPLYDQLKEKTGRDCALWLAEHCIANDIPIPLYYLHTKNPVGLMNMSSILESARKVMNGSKA
jgi:hypothetical protein